ncbi:MAG: hypothetical protein ACJ8OJ_02860 [Povalibacter sp.]
MHASIDQLLSIRDGEPVDAELLRHIARCGTCASELERLLRVQERMRSLEMPEPPAMAWERVRERASAREPVHSRRIAFAAAAALAATAILSGLWLRHSDSPSSAGPVVASGHEVQAQRAVSLEHLLAQSRELDEMLSSLPQRPAVERVAMAATIDTIEQRVQWLDQQLSYAPEVGLEPSQTYQLWRERVDLMDSLVKVRYAEGGPLLF